MRRLLAQELCSRGLSGVDVMKDPALSHGIMLGMQECRDDPEPKTQALVVRFSCNFGAIV